MARRRESPIAFAKYEGLCAIYVVTDGHGTKVGIANDPAPRLNALQTGNPRELKMVWTCWVPDSRIAYRVESAVIEALTERGCSIRGEWFSVTAAEAIAAWQQALVGLRIPFWATAVDAQRHLSGNPQHADGPSIRTSLRV